MKPIPEIVKEHVLKTQGRMPKTDKEIDDYLDLINHAKEYEAALIVEDTLGKKWLKKLGLRSTAEIKNKE